MCRVVNSESSLCHQRTYLIVLCLCYQVLGRQVSRAMLGRSESTRLTHTSWHTGPWFLETSEETEFEF